MNYYGMGTQITINYWSLHKCSPSSQTMCWVRPITIELSNGRKAFYLKGIDWKKNFMLLNSWWNPLALDTRKLTCVQTSASCTILKMQSWLSAKHVGMLVINPELEGKWLLSHIKNIDTSQSYLDCMSPKIVKHMTWHDIIYTIINNKKIKIIKYK